MDDRPQPARVQRLRPLRFERVCDLREASVAHADELLEPDHPMLHVVKEAFVLPGVGLLGALAVDDTGALSLLVPSITQEQSAQHLCGQLISSAAALSSCGISDIDHLTDGRLFRALSHISGRGDTDIATLRARCSEALESATVQYVVIVDACTDALLAPLAFLAAQSPLRVRAIELSRYLDAADNVVLVPEPISMPTLARQEPRTAPVEVPPVMPGTTEAASARTAPHPEVEAPTQTGHEVAAEETREATLLALQTLEAHMPPRLRVLRTENDICLAHDGWPRHLHYAFTPDEGNICLAIHLENDFVRPLADVLIPMAEELDSLFPSATILWDPTWSKNRGRLSIKPAVRDPAVLAETMAKLVEASAPRLDAALKSLRQHQRPRAAN